MHNLTDDKLETPTNIEPSESAWKIISNEGSTPDAAAFSVMGLLTLLLADSNTEEPLDQVEQKMHQEQLGKWLTHLSEQEQHVLKLRFGLDGNERHTLAEIGRLLEVSRERVRQVELKALRKLRNLTRKLPSSI